LIFRFVMWRDVDCKAGRGGQISGGGRGSDSFQRLQCLRIFWITESCFIQLTCTELSRYYLHQTAQQSTPQTLHTAGRGRDRMTRPRASVRMENPARKSLTECSKESMLNTMGPLNEAIHCKGCCGTGESTENVFPHPASSYKNIRKSDG